MLSSRALARVQAMPGFEADWDRERRCGHPAGGCWWGWMPLTMRRSPSFPPAPLAVHTVDFFRALVDDPYVLAQICVKHCLGDLYAMGATPQTALAIATVPYGTPRSQEETLFQLMAGAHVALTQASTAP
jgi:hypothetical protein